jgi:hypothetical protein
VSNGKEKIMSQMPKRPDLVLSNGAIVEFKVTRDQDGAVVVSRLEVSFPDSSAIPPGGITAQTIREIPLSQLTKAMNLDDPHRQQFRLPALAEKDLDQLLRHYPKSTGGKPVPRIYPAAMAYLFDRVLSEKPLNPNVAISELLGIPVETVATRLKRAKALGFLLRGENPRKGGNARGILSESAKAELLRFSEEEGHEH